MPQASSELQAKFPNGDTEAMDVLHVNFTWPAGLIRKNDPQHTPTQREIDAINYLMQEWDFGYAG
jgi:hypothetical protein